MSQTAYAQMRREARRTGWPRGLKKVSLWFHDRLFLARRRRPQQFGWLLREDGTDILLNMAASHAVLRHYRRYVNVYWYWFDGKKLRPTTPQELAARLKEQPAVTPARYPDLFP